MGSFIAAHHRSQLAGEKVNNVAEWVWQRMQETIEEQAAAFKCRRSGHGRAPRWRSF